MASYSYRESGCGEFDGRQSSLSLQGESLGRQSPSVNPKKSYRYRVVSHESSIDETLFGSHRDRINSGDQWRDSPPLKVPSEGRKVSPVIKPQLSTMPKTRNKYRIVKHTPTYVDHTLFGSPMQEPSFEAPWTDKKAERRRSAPLMWGPPVRGSLHDTDTWTRPSSTEGERSQTSSGNHPRSANDIRPASASGGRRRSSTGNRPLSASGRRSTTPNKPPPWK